MEVAKAIAGALRLLLLPEAAEHSSGTQTCVRRTAATGTLCLATRSRP